MQETWAQSLCWEDPREGMATHFSILAWKIPWTEEPGGAGHWVPKESDMTEHDTRAKSWNFKSDISFELKLVFMKFSLFINKEMIWTISLEVGVRIKWNYIYQISKPWSTTYIVEEFIFIYTSFPSKPLIYFPSIFPSIRVFQMSQLFASGDQSTGVSASTSVLSMNTQDWSPLGWTGWISLQSKGLSRVFSNTTVQKHQFFSAQLFL